jgi:hypothetical protein
MKPLARDSGNRSAAQSADRTNLCDSCAFNELLRGLLCLSNAEGKAEFPGSGGRPPVPAADPKNGEAFGRESSCDVCFQPP